MDIPSNKAVKKKKEGNHIEEFKLDEIGASKAQVEFSDWPKSRNSHICGNRGSRRYRRK